MSIWSYKFIGSNFEHTIEANSLEEALIKIRLIELDKELLFIKYLCF